jgi:HAMP domain-containing protein
MPHPLRSLRNRLTLIFALIVAGAIGIVYFYVTPRLEEELVTQKLERLAAEAQSDVKPLSDIVGDPRVEGSQLQRATERVATGASADVTLLQVSKNLPRFSRVAVSTPGGVRLDTDELAAQAIRTGKAVTATQQTDVGRQALAAQPLVRNERIRGVAIFADSLSDVEANVQLIRSRILAAGALALVLAAIAGYFAARALTGRIKRLERAARKVAGGDFSNPIHADSDDEIGQLAVAFDDMQRQLARLDTARKQFIAQASHELRTPIFSLGGFLELLEDEELDDDTRAQFLVQLRGQVERLRKLSTELLPAGVGRARAADRADGRSPARARRRGGVHARGAGPRRARGAPHGPRADRDRLRPGAGRAGDAHPARQRVRAHADGHVHPRFGRTGGRACHP